VIFGGVFLGAAHDFTPLAVSLRTGGKSIGEVAQDAIGPRAKLLFLLIVFFLLAWVLGVFLLAGGPLFRVYPVVILPVLGVSIVAMLIGIVIMRPSFVAPAIHHAEGAPGMFIAQLAGVILWGLLCQDPAHYPVRRARSRAAVMIM